GRGPKPPPAIAYRTVLGPDNQFCRVLNRPWKRYLGPDAARARNRHSCQPRAALAVEGSGKTQVPSIWKAPALHREAERDTTGSISRQHLVHTWTGGCAQGQRKKGTTGNLPPSATVRQHSL